MEKAQDFHRVLWQANWQSQKRTLKLAQRLKEIGLSISVNWPPVGYTTRDKAELERLEMNVPESFKQRSVPK